MLINYHKLHKWKAQVNLKNISVWSCEPSCDSVKKMLQCKWLNDLFTFWFG